MKVTGQPNVHGLHAARLVAQARTVRDAGHFEAPARVAGNAAMSVTLSPRSLVASENLTAARPAASAVDALVALARR